MPDVIETLVQEPVGMQRRDVARRQAPEHAVHNIARTWRDRAPPFKANEETITLENSRAQRPCARAPALHRRPVHVGAIGEVEGHYPGIAEVRSLRQRGRVTASSRSISRS